MLFNTEGIEVHAKPSILSNALTQTWYEPAYGQTATSGETEFKSKHSK